LERSLLVLELTTARLFLRPLGAGDAKPVHALWTRPGVRRFLWDDETISSERTRSLLAANDELMAAHRFGLWGAWHVESGRLTGIAGFWYFREPPELELMFAVADDAWGRGYATEMSGAVIQHGFSTLDMTRIQASTDTGHAASVRVLEKLGFRFTRRALVKGLDTLFYELERHEAVPAEP
jgi:RimJ/RimL family protein N-acetyltransferase